jgi:hypothetical protein
MEQRDILLWPDGFWCFKDEYHPDMMRDYSYVLLAAGTPKWLSTKDKSALPDVN